MPTIKVPDADGQVVITDGGEQIIYKISNGNVDVDDAHTAAILSAVQGSELAPESPAAKSKPESGKEK